MAKSRCGLCGRPLKAGEWMLRVTDGKVIKVCNNRDECRQRMRKKPSLYNQKL